MGSICYLLLLVTRYTGCPVQNAIARFQIPSHPPKGENRN